MNIGALTAALSALAAGIVLQNVVLARALCTDDPLHFTRTYRGVLRLGSATLLVTLMATLFSAGLRRVFVRFSLWAILRWPLCFLCVAAAFFLLKRLPLFRVGGQFARESEPFLLYVAFNGVAYAIVLLSLTNYALAWQAMVYAFGCCVGLTFAQMLIHAGRERLSLSLVPRSFAGLPILLLYIGILSLAIYGLIGHQLPT